MTPIIKYKYKKEIEAMTGKEGTKEVLGYIPAMRAWLQCVFVSDKDYSMGECVRLVERLYTGGVEGFIKKMKELGKDK